MSWAKPLSPRRESDGFVWLGFTLADAEVVAARLRFVDDVFGEEGTPSVVTAYLDLTVALAKRDVALGDRSGLDAGRSPSGAAPGSTVDDLPPLTPRESDLSDGASAPARMGTAGPAAAPPPAGGTPA